MFLANCKNVRWAAFFFIFVDFSGEGGGIISYPVKEKHIGSAVSEILPTEKQKHPTEYKSINGNTHTNIHLDTLE